jgi:hypothetical protein
MKNYLEVNEAASSITGYSKNIVHKYGDYQLEEKREDALIQFQQLLKVRALENLLHSGWKNYSFIC